MRVVRLVGGVFAAVGAVLLAIAGFIHLGDAAFAREARVASGVVLGLDPSRSSDGGTSYASRIRFVDASGRTVVFRESVSSSPPRHVAGETVRVLYDPARPESAVVDDFLGRRFGVAIVGGLGTLFALIGGTMLVVTVRAARRRDWLRLHGRAIEAEFLEVFVDRRLRINGRHPFRVAVQANDPRSGAIRRFESEAIWVDPTARLRGRKVRVLLDPAGGSSHVDLRGIVDERDI